MKPFVRALAVVLALAPVLVVAAPSQAKKYKILFITQSKGFMHGSVKRPASDKLAPAEVSVTELAASSGLFEVECTQDASVVTEEKLKGLDAVMFYTTGPIPLKDQFPQFETWLQSGKAMIGTHSATDTLGDFKGYSSLINGTFDGHPWGSGETVAVTVHDPAHTANKPWKAEFQIKDEIYQYKNYDPKAVRVLYSLNMAKCKTKAPYHVPVAWVREAGKGRLFYTNLGHNEATWASPDFKAHLLAGLRWALKLDDGPAVPNPELSYAEQAKAFLQVAGADSGKNVDELAAKAEKGCQADLAWGEKLYADIAGFRRIDKKKDGEKAKAEVARIIGEIEKK